MNMRSTFFSLVVMMLAIGVTESNAQGRGNDRGNDRGRSDHDQNRRSHSKRDRDDDDRYARRNDRHDHRDARRTVHVHERHYHPVVVHHHRHNVRPRYVYYKDYDVYYDYTNSAYISFNGRGWTISRAIPTSMRYVDVRRVKRYEIDYHDDNFAVYLDRKGRPQYGRECDW